MGRLSLCVCYMIVHELCLPLCPQGVHSAIQHDSIMSSGSSDYVVIETEAKKVAQSAARALRESRRRCLAGGGGGGGGWGQLTWTGQHGSAGGALRLPRCVCTCARVRVCVCVCTGADCVCCYGIGSLCIIYTSELSL